MKIAGRVVVSAGLLAGAVTVIDGSQPANPDSASAVTMMSGVIEGFGIRGGTGALNPCFGVRGGAGSWSTGAR